MTSNLEAAFDTYWRQLGGPDLEPEYRFAAELAGGPGKGLRARLAALGLADWRFDRAHLSSLIAIEVDGGAWTQGRHTRGAGFAEDCRKINAAMLAGWLVFRFTGDMLTSDPAGYLEPVIRLMERRAELLGEIVKVVHSPAAVVYRRQAGRESAADQLPLRWFVEGGQNANLRQRARLQVRQGDGWADAPLVRGDAGDLEEDWQCWKSGGHYDG